MVDNALPPVVADGLRSAGCDAVHVRELGMQRAEDDAIFAWAAQKGRIVVTADLDFGTILALGHGTEPSVVLLRRMGRRSPEEQVALVIASLQQLGTALEEGNIIVIEPNRIRVRSLPIGLGGVGQQPTSPPMDEGDDERL